MMMPTYLIVTTIIIDQKIRLSTPWMCSGSGDDRMMAGKGLAKGVDRAGADVAEHDADRADRQLQYALTLMIVRAGTHVRQRSNSGGLVHGSPRDG